MKRPPLRPIATLLFDLDGTLVDSRRDITASVNAVLRQLGHRERSVAEVSAFVGDGVAKLLQRALGDATPEQLGRARRMFLEHYLEHCLDTTVLYPGVRRTLARLRHQAMAVITNKPHAMSVKILAALQIDRYFRVVLGGESTRNKKPHPEPIRVALKRLGVPPAHAAMIGDSPNDLHAGQAAGTITCAVTYGLTPRKTLAAIHPDYFLDCFADLLPLLDEMSVHT